jgi:hypothetical protein
MGCEITIATTKTLVFKTAAYNFSRIEDFRMLFLLLDKKFPEKQAFVLEVNRFPRNMPAINRWDYRAACQSDDWRDPLKPFAVPVEFAAFQQSVKIMNLNDAYCHMGDLPRLVGLSLVRCYEAKTTIFEMGGQQPLFKICGPIAFQRNNLAEVEYQLYLAFLRYHDPTHNR